MIKLPKFYRDHGIPYIFDPGQQLPVLPAEELKNVIEGSFALITNDYELNMISKKTGLNEDAILGRTLWLITTLGEKGARVRGADGSDVQIPAANVAKVVDPTGAGDAQRAGFLKGLVSKLPIEEACKIGSVSASYAIEKLGTQEHSFDLKSFAKRYEEVYHQKLPFEF